MRSKINLLLDFQGDQPTANIAHLPPIVLGFELPPTYPHKDPPKINLSCKWLSPKQVKLFRICVVKYFLRFQ